MLAKIYINESIIPYLTLDFQTDICKRVADLKAYTVTEIITGKDSLQKLLTDKEYNTQCTIIIYNLSVLGETVKEILDYIERFSKHNVELISCFDDFALKNFGMNTEDNLFLTTVIAMNVKNIELWKQLQL